MNKGGVAIIPKTHISNVSSSNLGSLMADFAHHFLNPLCNESKSDTSICHDYDQCFPDSTSTFIHGDLHICYNDL